MQVFAYILAQRKEIANNYFAIYAKKVKIGEFCTILHVKRTFIDRRLGVFFDFMGYFAQKMLPCEHKTRKNMICDKSNFNKYVFTARCGFWPTNNALTPRSVATIIEKQIVAARAANA